MIMNKITELTSYVQNLSKKEFQQYVLGAVAAVAIVSLGTTYYVYNASSSLVQEIRRINMQTNKIKMLTAQNGKLVQEEDGIKKILEKDPEFSMSSYFEKFYTKHKIKPEQNWKPEERDVIEGSEAGIRYQEIVLRAMFKKQTMEKLVTILQDIYAEERIYVKEVEIIAEGSQINFELMLATKEYKRELGETE